MRRYLAIFLVVCTLLVDQWSKAWVRGCFSEGESLPLVEPVLHLTYIENQGAAFGIMAGHTLFFVVFTLLVLSALVFYVLKEAYDNRLAITGMSFVVGGALGNLVDRVMKGSVTDMFDLRIWPVFNVADIAVCLGFGLLLVYLIFYSEQRDDSYEN